jgi:chemotaxis protein methyltransferase CheR
LLDGRTGETELDALAATLTIGETFFFRHQELFDALRERVLPELIERNRPHQRLRIWSAGCAIGAEPYSLAILLRKHFGPQIAGWDVSIVGTDINREFLAQAQRGQFGEWSFRSAPDGLKESCFVHAGQAWTIDAEYRRGVVFQYHNLVQHPFPSLINGLSAFDLILCRNVMIYFAPTVVSRLVGQFRDSLVDGGWFVVGPSEPSVGLFQAFQTVNSPGAVLYRKGPQLAAPLEWAPPDIGRALAPSPSNRRAPREAIAILPQSERETFAGRRRPPNASHHRRSRPLPARHEATLADVRANLNSGQSEAAADHCQKLISADRLNPLVYFYHALVREQQGQHAETEQALRRAIYLDRDFVLAHYHLGLVMQRYGDVRAAQRSFRNVLVLLQARDEDHAFVDADGLTVGALRRLTEMHLEVLSRT